MLCLHTCISHACLVPSATREDIGSLEIRGTVLSQHVGNTNWTATSHTCWAIFPSLGLSFDLWILSCFRKITLNNMPPFQRPGYWNVKESDFVITLHIASTLQSVWLLDVLSTKWLGKWMHAQSEDCLMLSSSKFHTWLRLAFCPIRAKSNACTR